MPVLRTTSLSQLHLLTFFSFIPKLILYTYIYMETDLWRKTSILTLYIKRCFKSTPKCLFIKNNVEYSYF